MNEPLPSLRRAVRLVALLNLGYFGAEFAVARAIGSVALFADSVDFLEDAAVNFLVLAALGWGARARAATAMTLAGLLLVPGFFTLSTAWAKFQSPAVPHAGALTAAGAGALGVNLFCAFHLARFRADGGSLPRAAYLSARNDAIANVAIVAAGGLTAAIVSPWPDLAVGLGVFALNLGAAREVWEAARREKDSRP